ncbi:hypothetical protein JOQ06_002690, partial [Pogonophryne albipinna]
MDRSDDIEVRRECILKCLCTYLHEDSGKLVGEYLSSDIAEAKKKIAETNLPMYPRGFYMHLRFLHYGQRVHLSTRGRDALEGHFPRTARREESPLAGRKALLRAVPQDTH